MRILADLLSRCRLLSWLGDHSFLSFVDLRKGYSLLLHSLRVLPWSEPGSLCLSLGPKKLPGHIQYAKKSQARNVPSSAEIFVSLKERVCSLETSLALNDSWDVKMQKKKWSVPKYRSSKYLTPHAILCMCMNQIRSRNGVQLPYIGWICPASTFQCW